MKLYHRTSAAAAAALVAGQPWRSRENTQEVYFSSIPNGHTDGYGDTVVSVDVPAAHAELEDEFPDGEQHFRVPLGALQGIPVTRVN